MAGCVAAHHRLTPADRGYCCLPLFHINAEVVGLLATLAARGLPGGRPQVQPARVLGTDRGSGRSPGSTRFPRSSPSWPWTRPWPTRGRVRFVRSASAPLAPSALRRFEDSFGIPVVETYGMTEAASMITANPLDGPRKAGSAGLPAGTEVRVISRDGGSPRPCPPGTIGRVQIRGPGVITEYAEGGAGRRHRRGRLARDRRPRPPGSGRLPVPGRALGRRDQPGRGEDLPAGDRGVPAHPARGPVRRGGRGPRRRARAAAGRLRGPGCGTGVRPAADPATDPAAGPGGPDLAEALRAACSAALPRPKRPTEFCLVPELPVGATGKVSRRRLRELAAAPG